MNLAQLVEYFEQKRIEDGRIPAKVRAIRPFNAHHPGRALIVVFNVNGVLLGNTTYAPDEVDWNSPRPPGVVTRAQLPRRKANA